MGGIWFTVDEEVEEIDWNVEVDVVGINISYAKCVLSSFDWIRNTGVDSLSYGLTGKRSRCRYVDGRSTCLRWVPEEARQTLI